MYVQYVYVRMVPDLGWFSSAPAVTRVSQPSFDVGSLPSGNSKRGTGIYMDLNNIYLRTRDTECLCIRMVGQWTEVWCASHDSCIRLQTRKMRVGTPYRGIIHPTQIASLVANKHPVGSSRGLPSREHDVSLI